LKRYGEVRALENMDWNLISFLDAESPGSETLSFCHCIGG
jgi:hypothetical protein